MVNDEENSVKRIVIPEEFDQMIPKKKKNIIVNMIEEEIKNQGLEGKLVFSPIESGYMANRKKYYPKGGVAVFEEYMSQLNTLPFSFLEIEIREIVNSARRHFKF